MDQGAQARVAQTRAAIRTFLRDELEQGSFVATCDAWIQGFSPEFSRRLGQRGWLGMTWPARWGGRAATAAERLAVLEELLAAGAPVAAHWMAERQVGPLLMRFGSDEQRARMMPAIARGELYTSIGLSEPNSGSDLASVSTRGRRIEDGWSISGQKVWTSNADRAHVLIALVRTDDFDDRHLGLTQFLIPLDAPGLTVRPILTMTGGADFCEVFLDDVRLGTDSVVGRVGDGWNQVNAELSDERSGPERYLSVYPLLAQFLDRGSIDADSGRMLGKAVAELWALRSLSAQMAGLEASPVRSDPVIDMVTLKGCGTAYEQWLAQALSRQIADSDDAALLDLHAMSRHAVLSAPSFTLRGGTSEILRTMLARRLSTMPLPLGSGTGER